MRSLVPIALLLGTIGLSACGSSEESPVDSAGSPEGQSRPPSRTGGRPSVVAIARGRPEVEPRRLELTALEGHPFALADISWATWGGAKATGEATLQAVKCDPECAYGDYADRFPVHVVLRGLDSRCGEPLYRKAFVFRSGEGQYFPIACPAGMHETAVLLKKDFGVSGRCVKLGHPGSYECYADGSHVGRMRLRVNVSRSRESVTITKCEPAIEMKSNEAGSCSLRRLRG
jgi:hypothetical protein